MRDLGFGYDRLAGLGLVSEPFLADLGVPAPRLPFAFVRLVGVRTLHIALGKAFLAKQQHVSRLAEFERRRRIAFGSFGVVGAGPPVFEWTLEKRPEPAR